MGECMKKPNKNMTEIFHKNYPHRVDRYMMSREGEKALRDYVDTRLKYFVSASGQDGWGKFAEGHFFGGDRQPCVLWLEEHCNGKWATHDWGFYFENSSDAMMFKLRWM